jgi:hypothetical protein
MQGQKCVRIRIASGLSCTSRPLPDPMRTRRAAHIAPPHPARPRDPRQGRALSADSSSARPCHPREGTRTWERTTKSPRPSTLRPRLRTRVSTADGPGTPPPSQTIAAGIGWATTDVARHSRRYCWDTRHHRHGHRRPSMVVHTPVLGIQQGRPVKVCAEPGCPTLTPNSRCPTHTRARDRARGSRQSRGYDTNHDRLRAQWAPRVATGTIPCARCHRLITPTDPWDLGHHDTDRSKYTGPEHATCNRAAGARQPRQRRR